MIEKNSYNIYLIRFIFPFSIIQSSYFVRFLTLHYHIFYFNVLHFIVGRIEAVMVSCPPLVAWDYNHTPAAGSSEESLMGILKNPVDWSTK